MAQPKRTTSYDDYKNKKRSEEEKKMKAQSGHKSERSTHSLPQKESIKKSPDKPAKVEMHTRAVPTVPTHSESSASQIAKRRKSHRAPRERRGGGLLHLILGILVGLILVSLAFAIPHFMERKNTDSDASVEASDSTSEVIATLEDVVFPEEADRLAKEVEAKAAVAKENIANGDGDNSDDTTNSGSDTDTLAGGGDNGSASGNDDSGSTDNDVEEVVAQPVPSVEPTPEPVPVTPQYGAWQLLYMNTEKFELDDEDSDVTEIEIKDVCKSIYKQNANVVSYCDETSKLRKTTASNLGKDRCEGNGGSCRYGRTCLLWNTKEDDDDGDVKLYTAMYRCE